MTAFFSFSCCSLSSSAIVGLSGVIAIAADAANKKGLSVSQETGRPVVPLSLPQTAFAATATQGISPYPVNEGTRARLLFLI